MRQEVADIHASTRILLLLVAVAAILGGWWILVTINDDVVTEVLYGVLWAAVVLVTARVLLAIGFGYNRLTAGRGARPTAISADPAAALAELTDLRDRGLISADEYEAKRAKVMERL
jgi:hypothetical protein